MKLCYIEQIDMADRDIPVHVGRAYALSLLASFVKFREGVEVRSQHVGSSVDMPDLNQILASENIDTISQVSILTVSVLV